MNHAQLLFPDFSLILCGYLVCRFTALNRSVWSQVDSLVYYLLFPVLLFHSISRSPLDLMAGDRRHRSMHGVRDARRFVRSIRHEAHGAQRAFLAREIVGDRLAARPLARIPSGHMHEHGLFARLVHPLVGFRVHEELPVVLVRHDEDADAGAGVRIARGRCGHR